jgi:hypothetical protein
MVGPHGRGARDRGLPPATPTTIAGVPVRGRSTNFAAREAARGPQRHLLRCGICSSIESAADKSVSGRPRRAR